MIEVLNGLAERALREQAVMTIQDPGGVHLMAYPLADLMLFAVGLEGEQADRLGATALLQKRQANLSRYGNWQPTKFVDGSYYIVHRATVSNEIPPTLEPTALEAALELMQ